MSLCASGGVREGCLEEVTQRASMVRHQEGSKLLVKTVGFHWSDTCLAPRQGRWAWAGLGPPSPPPVLCCGLGHACCPSGQAVLSLSSGSRW